MGKRDYLLCVGRLEKQKAFHYAIEGFVGITNDFPNLRLKIVGQGSLEQTLKQCAHEFGVADRIDFEGFQADMIPYYLHAKATLLTSLYEGFPNVLVESITLGTPVVAFDCPSGPREIIQEGVNGYLVDYLSIGDLQKICRISLVNPLARETLQASAYKYFFSHVMSNYESFSCIELNKWIYFNEPMHS